MLTPAIGICAIALFIFTALLLWAELSQNTGLKFIAKPLASLSFISLALICGAWGSFYGQIILGALIVCAIGDVLLLPAGTGPWFRRGVAAFLAGHVAYILAVFALWAPSTLSEKQWLALPLSVMVFGRIYKQLRGAKGDWLIEVYTVIIIAMVIGAIAAGVNTGFWLPAIAAGMFAVSDMFVSRNRFGPRTLKQFWLITPLYFAAQGVFALSILYQP